MDEHKILTVRVEPELCDRVERVLGAFGLSQIDDPSGADAAAHEHRSVLLIPEDQPELLGPDEILDIARDSWRLVLNVDPDSNLDENGEDLGITPWRCLVRRETDEEPARVAEVVCTASCLREAESLSLGGVDTLIREGEGRQDTDEETEGASELVLLRADRVAPEDISVVREGEKDDKSFPDKFLEHSTILASRWLDTPQSGVDDSPD